MKIKDFTRNYSKQKSIHNRNTLAELYGKLNDTDSALAVNPECVATKNQRDQVKIKIQLLEQQKSRAVQVRSRVKWVEQSRANSKMMERVTDDKGRTFTKQIDIIIVQRDFF